jgi:hypothetical protein
LKILIHVKGSIVTRAYHHVIDGDNLQILREAVNIMNKNSWETSPPALKSARGISTPHYKKLACYEIFLAWTYILE